MAGDAASPLGAAVVAISEGTKAGATNGQEGKRDRPKPDGGLPPHRALPCARPHRAQRPLEFVRDNAWADGFLAMPLEVMMRFGRWDDVLAQPDFPEFAPISRALRLYARGVARAGQGDVAGARAEQAAFAEARGRVPKDATFGNNAASDILDVAESLLEGEILYRDGKADAGIAALREAVAREDKLRYDEPPDWIQPVRHALGAALLGAGRFDEAEAVFREDLRRLPDNGWGLYGLHRALQMQKRAAESAAAERRFDAIWRDADLKIKSPCLCLPGV